MTPSAPFRILVLAGLLSMLAACNSSDSSDDPTVTDADANGAGDGLPSDDGDTPPAPPIDIVLTPPADKTPAVPADNEADSPLQEAPVEQPAEAPSDETSADKPDAPAEEAPDAPSEENPDALAPESPDAPSEENPDEPAAESPDAPSEENPDEPAEEAPDAPSEENPDAPAEETPDAPAEETPDAPADENPDAPSEENPDAPAEETPDAPAEENPDAPAEETPDAPAEENPDAPAEETPDAPSEETPAEQTPDTDVPEPVIGDNTDNEPSSGDDVPLIPAVQDGSDLDRLIEGMTRQALITLLDLNRRFAQGEEFSAQQEQCLGSYEPGNGVPVLSIDCEQALVTNGIPLYVGQAELFDTEQCRAALSSQSADGCVLKTLDLLIRTEFTVAEGVRRPTPSFSGALLDYTTDVPVLKIDNLEQAVTGVFSCSIDLNTGDTTAALGVSSCPDLVADMADKIEQLQGF